MDDYALDRELVRDVLGKERGISVFVEDITERKRAEEKIKRCNKELGTGKLNEAASLK